MRRSVVYRMNFRPRGGAISALICVLAVLTMAAGCGEPPLRVPKPRAYPKIVFPERHFVDFSLPDCPCSFRYPDYLEVIRRQNFFDEKPAHPCWFDLHSEHFDATIHWSYYPIRSGTALGELVTDAFKMSDRINQRANFMDEHRVANAQGISGLIMEFGGSAASPLHFYLTDSTQHFLKASLYFQSRVVPDSLAPIAEFMKSDIAEMINTVTFN